MGKESPIKNIERFEEAQYHPGSFTSLTSFYCYYKILIQNYFDKDPAFSCEKLSKIACAGLGINEESKHPFKSSMSGVVGSHARICLTGSGLITIKELAIISLAAAAFDLCYTLHYQGGIPPE